MRIGSEIESDLYTQMVLIEAQTKELAETAHEMGTTPTRLRDANGNWPFIQLLQARANLLFVESVLIIELSEENDN